MHIYLLKKFNIKIILLFIAAAAILPFSQSYAQPDKDTIDNETTAEDTVSSAEADTIVSYLGFPADSNSSIEYDLENRKILIFGTDSIYDDTNVPTGIQAQSLCQPYEIPLGAVDPKVKYIETSVEFVQSHLNFLMTDKVQTNPPFKRNRRGFSIQGLKLSAEVCENILYRNARSILYNAR